MSNHTNGWDAVLALSTASINDILFYDYAKDGPSRRASLLRVLVSDNRPGEFYALELTLGPPLVDLTNEAVKMLVLDGRLSFIDHGRLKWMMPIERDSSLQGPLHLADVTGKEVVGEVTLDLAKGTFLPTLVGVDPSSTLPAEISNAIQAYYKGASVELKIGSVVAGNVPAALQPTEFKMFKQQQPNGSDSCILFLIKTNGPGGNVSPLDAYPLGADVSAALILSDRTIFDGIIPLTKLPDGLSFASKESNGQRSVTLNGTVNCGTYGDDYNDGFSPGYSCNQYGQFSSVYLPLNGLEIHPANGGLAGGAKYSWTLYYMEWYLMHTAAFRHQLDLHGSVSLSLQPTVDPDTCVVSFKGSVPVDVSGGMTSSPFSAWGRTYSRTLSIPHSTSSETCTGTSAPMLCRTSSSPASSESAWGTSRSTGTSRSAAR